MEVSRTQIRNLGSRLRGGAETPEDGELLQAWIRSHDVPMREVSRIIGDELGLKNTPRLKTRKTLVEKLVREKTNLLNMDDIAGVRLDAHACGINSLVKQDDVAARIAERFPDHKFKDRRAAPNFGYRAVHLVVRHDGAHAEVQVRTEFQHQWAEVTEKLADLVGRGLRYGVAPADKAARGVHSVLLQLSIHLARFEALEAEVARGGAVLAARLKPDLDELRESMPELLALARDAVADFDQS